MRENLTPEPSMYASARPNYFRNEELEAKTAMIQAEFNTLLNTHKEGKKPQEDLDMKSFYSMMDEFYGKVPRHESPTKRLVNLKDTTVLHKGLLKNNLQRTKDYGLTYCTTPDKTYVIEPDKGELDYDKARKDPLKFVEKVISEDIVKHKLTESK